ncbi:thiamine biosynthesis lipoprotein [Novosphingobium sp. PhB165]|uniref:FAD:protein FMN transferase n=1 Tax=Novosphingobium sp. PhB165 TaxID=2485105 RepID=UPI001043412B|nr:FAD:protein FMN transferase [Novosphingobium sp. PhB165]TCM13018.1 thiamine biosynthesis lipoprotein [Novosphingobium sp. PhB165]
MHDQMVRRCRPILGTFVEIAVPEAAAASIDPAFARIEHIHARMSFHSEDSDLAALRRARPDSSVHVDSATIGVLRLAKDLYHQTDGVFDAAVGRQLVEWGFLPQPAGYRDKEWIGGMPDVEILDEAHVSISRATLLDLGGIAKGYAVDCAVETLLEAGAPSGIVNAGGDLRVFGEWEEIVHLREADETLGASLAIRNAALASSSNLHNRRQHRTHATSPHVLGEAPVLAGDAVTVIAERCVIADAMTKVAIACPTTAGRVLATLNAELIDRRALGATH